MQRCSKPMQAATLLFHFPSDMPTIAFKEGVDWMCDVWLRQSESIDVLQLMPHKL